VVFEAFDGGSGLEVRMLRLLSATGYVDRKVYPYRHVPHGDTDSEGYSEEKIERLRALGFHLFGLGTYICLEQTPP
jgi:hypothetical protein